ncbi:TetR/AcrR family transcriptional regulator [Halioxenophilus aromaticivorans]|uniref:HTH tetR-type domain-containing protein n=1 Tax=Halioxenophilus aromaticivorans TaxID=1306992 RepID=A0AAV3U5P2_9ALTE
MATEQETLVKRGPYKSGVERKKQIIEAARLQLIEQGYHNFSIRKVAKRVGLSAGNVQHHFSSRLELIAAMLDYVIENYFTEFDQAIANIKDPKEKLFIIIQHVTRDLTTLNTTVFFPEMWSLANHEPEIDELVEEMYRVYRNVYERLAIEINPALSQTQAENFALFLASSLEGHTVFIGHNKKHTHACEAVITMAYNMALGMLNSGNIPK